MTKEKLIEEYSNNLRNGKASLFIGSGLSCGCGYPSWRSLLKECAEELDLEINKENDLISLAQFYLNSKSDRTTINNLIKDTFDVNKGELNDNYRIISALPLKDIWTTNYDRMIEKAFDEYNARYSVLTNDKSYRNVDFDSRVMIHKIHGDYKTPSECVIAREDYDKFESTHEIPLAELKGQMTSRSFLFLGYGFGDGDIQHILTRIRLLFDKENPFNHYNVMKTISKDECADANEYKYRLKKQNHFVKDLSTYGVQTVLIEDYSEITDILNEIKKRYYKNSIFIGGAYEGPNKRLETFVTELSKRLMEENKTIITGYGKDFGQYITNGCFIGNSKRKDGKSFSETLEIIAFPFSLKDGKEKHYAAIRKYMASKSSISIFIAGIKIVDGKETISDGMLEEYKFSLNNGHLIIPIPLFDGAAKDIYKNLIAKKEYSYLKTLDKVINETDDDSIIIEEVMNIIKCFS